MSRSTFCLSIAMSVISCIVLTAGVAQATPVTVQMYFESFTGAVGSDFQFVTYMDTGSGPFEVCPDAGCGSGIGDANVQFGNEQTQVEFWNSDFGVDRTRNFLSFVSSGEQDVELGEEFLLGTLTYTNGIWFTDPDFAVKFVSESQDSQFDGQIWADTLHLSITTNVTTNTPEQNADFVYLTGMPNLGSVRAYELSAGRIGNSVTAQLYGSINSIDLSRFANASGDGFLDPSIALEPTSPGTVPEPASLALLAAALAVLSWLRLRHDAATCPI